MLGGAALTRSYVERDLREVYDGRVFYGKDAFEGLRVMDRLGELRRSGEDDPDFGRVPTGRILPPRSGGPTEDGIEVPRRSPEVAEDNRLFVPPFLGSKVVKGLSLDEILAYVNETALFRNQWQFRPEGGEPDEAFKERIRPTLRAELAKAREADLLVPQVVYGYFPVNAEGHDLIVWKDDDRTAEWLRFSYPRQRRQPYLCISDFFRPVGSRRARLRRVPHRVDGVEGVGGDRPAVRREPLPGLPAAPRARAWSWPRRWPSTGTPASGPSGASATRTATACWASSARSSGAAATRGATPPARTWRTTPRWPNCSTPTASA